MAIRNLRDESRTLSDGQARSLASAALGMTSGVGVVAATWALLFPPTRPSEVTRGQGDTP